MAIAIGGAGQARAIAIGSQAWPLSAATILFFGRLPLCHSKECISVQEDGKMSVITFLIDKSALRFYLQTVPFETASSPDKFVMHRGPCPLNERPLELFQMVPGCRRTFGTKHSPKLPAGKSLKITSGKSVMRQQAFLPAPRLAIRTAGSRGREGGWPTMIDATLTICPSTPPPPPSVSGTRKKSNNLVHYDIKCWMRHTSSTKFWKSSP